MMSPEYAAGFFDGEGCVRLTATTECVGGIHVFITNTYKPILDTFATQFGGTVSLRTESNDRHKTIYQWRIASKKGARVFLEAVLPHLVEKREQALVGLEYCSLPDLRINRFTRTNSEMVEGRRLRADMALRLKELKHTRVNWE